MKPVCPLLSFTATVAAFRAEQLLAYPTESVFGLGCLAVATDTIVRLQQLKERPVQQGFITVVDSWASVAHWCQQPPEQQLAGLSNIPSAPVTFIFAASAAAPSWLCRQPDHTIALRLTDFEPLKQLIAACGPLVSTSANHRGQNPCRTAVDCQNQLGALIDGVMMADVGGVAQPSMMIEAATGRVLRGQYGST